MGPLTEPGLDMTISNGLWGTFSQPQRPVEVTAFPWNVWPAHTLPGTHAKIHFLEKKREKVIKQENKFILTINKNTALSSTSAQNNSSSSQGTTLRKEKKGHLVARLILGEGPTL